MRCVAIAVPLACVLGCTDGGAPAGPSAASASGPGSGTGGTSSSASAAGPGGASSGAGASSGVGGAGGGGGGPVLPPPSVFVATDGDDAASCSKMAPCLTFDRAYRVATPGVVVEVAGGAYAAQTIAFDDAKIGASESVFFVPAAGGGVSIGGTLKIEAQHIEVRDMAMGAFYAGQISGMLTQDQQARYVVFRNIDADLFTITGASDITIIGGDIGPSPAAGASSRVHGCDKCPYAPDNIVMEGVTFHDFSASPCLHVYSANHYVLRSSRFRGCTDASVMINNHEWGPAHDITVENNFFADSRISLGPNGSSLTNVLIRNNSFTAGPLFSTSQGSFVNTRVVSNIGALPSYACAGGGIDYRHNVWTQATCSGSDIQGPLGYADAAAFDQHLVDGAAAVDHGDPADAPALDIDGDARPMGAAPDCGADEHQ